MLGWWWCQSSLWTNSVAWQRRVEDLQSCNRTIEAFVRSGPRCVSITVHLLITPSNPKARPSIVGYSSHDLNIELEGARLIPVVKPMWGLISWLDLTSRAIGFKSVSDDDIPFLAPASPCQTRAAITSARSGAHVEDGNDKPRPQKRSHYSSQVETWHSLSEPFVWFAASRLVAVYSQQTCRLQKGTAEALLLCLLSGAPSLSLRAVTTNKGSNKSTVWSLLATIPLIIADTWDR